MAGCLAAVSVIMPVHGPDRDHVSALRAALQGMGAEVIIASDGTRAKSLNAGAGRATRDFLWFLHADTILTPAAGEALGAALHAAPDRLHYFDLAFSGDGPPLMALNACGANIRSRLLGVPFGDQGLCIRKDLFQETGGYPEDVLYGEDHIFVWRARRRGIKLCPVGIPLITSARRYAQEGWLKTTVRYQYLWLKQALPQFFLWIRGL